MSLAKFQAFWSTKFFNERDRKFQRLEERISKTNILKDKIFFRPEIYDLFYNDSEES